jgi:DNA modification methylase
MTTYRSFLEAKIVSTPDAGIPLDPGVVHPICKPHQRDIIEWAVRGGRRAIFARFGLGKTVIMLENMRLILQHETEGCALVIAPLGVRSEFLHDARMLGTPLTFVRTTAEITGPGIYLTNYESVREGKIDVRALIASRNLVAVGLDEAEVLRGFGGTKTFREFMAALAGDDRTTGVRTDGVKYRFVATATPSPNDYIELLAYAAFLGIMDVGEGKTRFFKRDPAKADNLTLYEHKVAEWWHWVSTWAVFLQSPADLGHTDEGYAIPPLHVEWHCIDAGQVEAGEERDGQHRLIRDAALGVTEASREKRATIGARVNQAVRLVEQRSDDQVIVWCDLNDEQDALETALIERGISLTSLRGAQDVDERDGLLAQWKARETVAFVSKPSMYGAGVNLQQCHTMVFTGIGFKARDIIQAVHRIYRFQQQHPCTVHLIYTDAETEVRRKLEAKWQRHETMMARMSEIIREYGLGMVSGRDALVRTIGCARTVVRGERFTAVHNDCVEEMAHLADDSVGFICTSIPFGTMYEYSPSYNDFGHTDDDAHFWEQMGFLSPELRRVLQPGRVLAVHVKDRVRPGGLDGWSFQTIGPFHAHAILHYARQGLAYMGMITITTDVVRENAQTYRLGWSEQCKDGSKMSVGLPEYVLLFRKPPTDASNGYADVPVRKDKSEYSRARWQFDADGHWRSSGNRLLLPEEYVGLEAASCFQQFKAYSEQTIYDHEHAVAIAEARERANQLPPSFKLLQLQSHLPDVWADLVRMRTLNTTQYAKGREQHVCPFPIDLVQRLITRFTNPGDLVLDPFGGLGTTAVCAVEMGREAYTVELNAQYHGDAVRYLQAAEDAVSAPTLFDLLEAEVAGTA